MATEEVEFLKDQGKLARRVFLQASLDFLIRLNVMFIENECRVTELDH